jgi:hypothetical protein
MKRYIVWEENGMKKRGFCFVIATILCLSGVVGCSKKKESKQDTEQIAASQLQEANAECIQIESHDVIMQNDREGTVKLTVKLPDYETLYKEAYVTENPDRYLLAVLESGKYKTIQYEITAKVTMEDGKEVIHKEEAVKALLEQELSKATNALIAEVY